MLNIAVLVSGGGTNLQAMLDAKARGEIPNGRFACVVASNPKAYALERAKNAGVETEVLVRKEFSTQDAYDDEMCIRDRNKVDILEAMETLNLAGQEEAVNHVKKMASVEKYQKKSFVDIWIKDKD